MSERDRIIEKLKMTLNLPRSTCYNPNLSAYVYLFGQFDWNATLLTPQCTKFLAYDKPYNQPT